MLWWPWGMVGYVVVAMKDGELCYSDYERW